VIRSEASFQAWNRIDLKSRKRHHTDSDEPCPLRRAFGSLQSPILRIGHQCRDLEIVQVARYPLRILKRIDRTTQRREARICRMAATDPGRFRRITATAASSPRPASARVLSIWPMASASSRQVCQLPLNSIAPDSGASVNAP